ncbi:hypothetical protein SKAU_G00143040 [Synaphobranchus kaupii]|uniref:Uncharacterized protein n=1 Tax=Synaphobranchus kaupii TaxID=118154 RepID=A0A9Q1FSU4_SYNKA|nr:hypothetical protein SKAU_G00143040 [Synaphobranchus kaupii]
MSPIIWLARVLYSLRPCEIKHVQSAHRRSEDSRGPDLSDEPTALCQPAELRRRFLNSWRKADRWSPINREADSRDGTLPNESRRPRETLRPEALSLVR